MKEQGIHVSKTATRIDGRWQIGTSKSEQGDRLIPVQAPILAALEEHRARQAELLAAGGVRQSEETPVFATRSCTMRDYQNIVRDLRALCAKAELPYFSTHGFRRTFASIQHENGVPLAFLAMLMGHSDAATTLRHYIAPDEAKLPQYAMPADVLLGDNKR